MLISRTHSFLFIHIAKTGGTSIAAALREFCDPPPPVSLTYRLRKILPVRCQIDTLPQPTHASAIWVHSRLGEVTYNKLFSFAVVRNPFDQMVSKYEFVKRSRGHRDSEMANELTFSQYLERKASTSYIFRKTQTDHVTNQNGKIIVNQVFRFENLNELTIELKNRTGISIERLPHLNSTKRKPYTEYYNDSSRRIVERIFKRDLEKFSYRFDGD
jgi:hypothetical protein